MRKMEREGWSVEEAVVSMLKKKDLRVDERRQVRDLARKRMNEMSF